MNRVAESFLEEHLVTDRQKAVAQVMGLAVLGAQEAPLDTDRELCRLIEALETLGVTREEQIAATDVAISLGRYLEAS